MREPGAAPGQAWQQARHEGPVRPPRQPRVRGHVCAAVTAASGRRAVPCGAAAPLRSFIASVVCALLISSFLFLYLLLGGASRQVDVNGQWTLLAGEPLSITLLGTGLDTVAAVQFTRSNDCTFIVEPTAGPSYASASTSFGKEKEDQKRGRRRRRRRRRRREEEKKKK